MTPSFLVEQGDFAVRASLMVGGYLAAAVILSYLPTRTNLHHAGRLAAALIIVIGALFPLLSPLALITGGAAALVLWVVSTTQTGQGFRQGILHLVTLSSAAVLVGLLDVTNEWLDYWRSEPAAVSRIGVYLAAYALVTAPAAHAIAWLLNRINLGSGSSTPVARHAVPDSLSLAGEDQGEGEASQINSAGNASRGRVIGILERLILLTLGLLGQWQAAGLVIAAKSIARFRNLEDRDFAEYYLVGTLASLLIAFLAAAAALAIT